MDVFRRDGRVTMLDNMALSDTGNVPYQASKREMEQFARYMAKEIEGLDLKSAADELCEKGKRVKNPDGRKDIEDAVAFIDELNESKQSGRLDKVASVCDKYPISEIGGIISAIVSGNILGLTMETLRTLIKLLKISNNQ